MAFPYDDEENPLATPQPTGEIIEQAELSQAPDTAPAPEIEVDAFARGASPKVVTTPAPVPTGRQTNPLATQIAQTPDAFAVPQVEAPLIYHRRYSDPNTESRAMARDQAAGERQRKTEQTEQEKQTRARITGLKQAGVEFETDLETGEQRPKMDGEGRVLYKPETISEGELTPDGRVVKRIRDRFGAEHEQEVQPQIDAQTGERFILGEDGVSRKSLGVDREYFAQKESKRANQVVSVLRQEIAAIGSQEKEIKKRMTDLGNEAAQLGIEKEPTQEQRLRLAAIQADRQRLTAELAGIGRKREPLTEQYRQAQQQYFESKKALLGYGAEQLAKTNPGAALEAQAGRAPVSVKLPASDQPPGVQEFMATPTFKAMDTEARVEALRGWVESQVEWRKANLPNFDKKTEEEFRGQFPDRGGFFGPLRELSAGIWSALVDQFPEDIARIARNGDMPLKGDSWADQWIREQEADKRAKGTSLQVLAESELSRSLAQGPMSIVTSAATGISGAAVGGLAGAGFGAVAGAGVASGAAFYRMAKDSFVDQVREMILSKKLDVTEAQWSQIKKDIEGSAIEYGLWEAGPEAISQAFTAGLFKGAGKLIGQAFGKEAIEGAAKNAVVGIVKRYGIEIGEELATETVTGIGQGAVEARVGLRDKAPTAGEVFKEVAGPTIVGAVLQGGAFDIYNRVRNARLEGRIALEEQADAETFASKWNETHQDREGFVPISAAEAPIVKAAFTAGYAEEDVAEFDRIGSEIDQIAVQYAEAEAAGDTDRAAELVESAKVIAKQHEEIGARLKNRESEIAAAVDEIKVEKDMKAKAVLTGALNLQSGRPLRGVEQAALAGTRSKDGRPYVTRVKGKNGNRFVLTPAALQEIRAKAPAVAKLFKAKPIGGEKNDVRPVQNEKREVPTGQKEGEQGKKEPDAKPAKAGAEVLKPEPPAKKDEEPDYERDIEEIASVIASKGKLTPDQVKRLTALQKAGQGQKYSARVQAKKEEAAKKEKPPEAKPPASNPTRITRRFPSAEARTAWIEANREKFVSAGVATAGGTSGPQVYEASLDPKPGFTEADIVEPKSEPPPKAKRAVAAIERALMAESSKAKRTLDGMGAKIVRDKKEPRGMSLAYFSDGTMELRIDEEAMEARIEGKDDQYVEDLVRTGLSEEIIHGANVAVLVERWKKSGQKVNFNQFFQTEMEDVWASMDEEQRQRAVELYGDADIENHNAAAEFIRQIQQVDAGMIPTEGVLRELLDDILDFFRRMIANKDTWSKPVQDLHDAIKAKLAEADGKKAEKPPVSDSRTDDEKPEKPKLSSTQVTLSRSDAAQFIEYGNSIPDADLYAGEEKSKDESDAWNGYGRETEPHITAFWGLEAQDPAAVKAALRELGMDKIRVKLGKTSLFENEDYDVLKVTVDSPDLHRIYDRLKKLPNQATFPDYQPHLTIAYLKSGSGKKYTGDARFEGTELTFDGITFSNDAREKTDIAVAEKKPAPAKKPKRDIMGTQPPPGGWKESDKVNPDSVKLLAELKAKRDAQGRVTDDRLESQIRNLEKQLNAEKPPAPKKKGPEISAEADKALDDAFDGLALPPEPKGKLRVAARGKNGQLFIGKRGELHRQIEAPADAVLGYVDKDFNFYTIKEAKDAFPETLGMPPEPQAALPPEKIGAFINAAQALIKSGIKTPEAMARVLEEKFAGKVRKYSEALWDAFGMVDKSLRGNHDWNAIYASIDAAQNDPNLEPESNDNEDSADPNKPAGGSNVRKVGAEGSGGSKAGAGDGKRDPETDAPILEDAPPPDVDNAPPDASSGAAGAGSGSEGGGADPAKPASGDAPDRRPGTSGEGLVSDGGRSRSSRGNYELIDFDAIVGGGPKARFERNRKAIELVDELEASNRDPTKEELDTLAGYTGWGAFGQELFQGNWQNRRPKPGWQKEDDWLRSHLGKDQWESAQRSIINAHYTDPYTIAAMWAAARAMGFTGGRILEPSEAIGTFWSGMPRDLMAVSQLTGIELDTVTHRIARILHPDVNHRNQPYQDSKTADDFYDFIIGNWPFANITISDRRYGALKPSLHDYFFLKAMDQVRPGGIVMGITSAFSMDRKGHGIRLALDSKADLVAAFRLPTGAFEGYAGTAVVTDIIILRKREEGEAKGSNRWIETKEVETRTGKIEVNEYYAANPQNVLGELGISSTTTYGRAGMNVFRQADFAEKLAAIANSVPKNIITPRTTKDRIKYITNNTGDRQNAVVYNEQGIFAVRGDQLANLDDIVKWKLSDKKRTEKREQQLRALVDMRKGYGKLIDAQREGSADQEELRASLRKLYEDFKKKHGDINESDGLSYIRKAQDPFYPSLAALERNIGTMDAPKWTPARILFEPTMRTKPRPENPNIGDAYVLHRNETTLISPAKIAEISKSTEDEVIAKLTGSGAIFKTPVGTWEPREIYLSGNVRRKLREAKEAVSNGDSDLQRNVEELEKVVPKDIPYFNIEAKLGNTWTTAEDYREFVGHLLGVEPDNALAKEIDIHYGPQGWAIQAMDRLNRRPEASSKWGIEGYPFHKIIRAALNNQAVKIWEKDSEGKRYVNEERSKAANQKVEAVREEFSSWVWKDHGRRIRLEASYNEIFNAIALPNYDGSFLSFEGMALTRGSGQFELRKHQQDAIWRGIVQGRGIYAHEVGTGKTYTMGGIAVESRRFGKARKPLIFAHNANSASVAAEIQEMYPAAKVLFIDNLDPDNRARTMAQIANDDWDAVVVPHSLIDRFTLKRETLDVLAAEEIAALEAAAIEAAQEDNIELDVKMMDDPEAMRRVRSATAKELVKQRERIKAAIDKAALRAKEDAIFFEDLGVDMIMVDEAHEFKKPPIATKMQMKGLNTQVSGKSINLFFLTEYTSRNNNGGNVHLFTGTPITNTLNEIYNLMRYTMSDVLKRDGVSHWDAWFNTFADSVTDAELTPAGEYEPVTRLASFVNTAELRRMVGEYMDTVFADDMPEMKPRPTKSGKTLKDDSLDEGEMREILNGRSDNPQGRPYKKIVTDVGEMSPDQKAIRLLLAQRAKRFRDADKKTRRKMQLEGAPEMPVRVETDAANSGLDQRLFDPNLKDHPASKVARMVKRAMEHYNEHPEATQAIFMERGFSDTKTRTENLGFDPATGKSIKRKVREKGFNLAKDIVNQLTAQGVPESQIAIVDGSTSPEKRKEIAAKMNRAEIRFVIGSYMTLGVGVNMQTNLRAMHHMDAPWRPGDLEQRNGRGHRQGNKWNTVFEYRYITEGIDGRRWQVLTIKQQFITAFLKANENTRVIEGDSVSMDEGEDISDIAETFAKAAGDPRLIIQAKLKKDVERLMDRERVYVQGLEQTRWKINEVENRIKSDTSTLPRIKKDRDTYAEESQKPFSLELNGKTYTDRDKANEAFEQLIDTFGDKKELIGSFRGFDIYGYKDFTREPQLELRGEESYKAKPSTGSLVANLGFIKTSVETIESRIEDQKRSVETLRESLNQPFGRASDLEKKKKMLESVEADLRNYPVPAPGWLREGAPNGMEVYLDGKKRVVMGQRWGTKNWFVVLEPENEGETPPAVPYTQVRDENNIQIFEERPFEEPIIKAANNLVTPNGIKVGSIVQDAKQDIYDLPGAEVTNVLEPGEITPEWVVEIKYKAYGREHTEVRKADALVLVKDGGKLSMPPAQGSRRGRSAEIEAATRGLREGSVSRSERDAVVRQFKPIAPLDSIPQVPSDERMREAIASNKRDRVGAARVLPDGKRVGIRMDIPAWTNHGVRVITIHEPAKGASAGPLIGYDGIARIRNPRFNVGSEKKAMEIAAGDIAKLPGFTVEGEWNPSREVPADLMEWTQVGYDPERHSYYWDRKTGSPVVSGEEAVALGSTVFVKGAVFGKEESFLYMPEGEQTPEDKKADTSLEGILMSAVKAMPEKQRKVLAMVGAGKTFAEAAGATSMTPQAAEIAYRSGVAMLRRLREQQAKLPEIFRAVDAEEAPNRTMGRPGLANVGRGRKTRRFIDTVDEIRRLNKIPEERADTEVFAEANRRMKGKYEKSKQELLDKAQSGAVLTDVETVMARKIVSREALNAVRQKDQASMMNAARLVDAYRMTGTEAARAFRLRRDFEMSPEERMAEYISEAILTPDKKRRKALDKADKEKDLETREAILKDWIAQIEKLKEKLRKLGFDLDNMSEDQLRDMLKDRTKAIRAIKTIAAAKSDNWDALYEFWISSLLSAPSTHVANIVGNSANAFWDMTAQRFVEAIVNVFVRDPKSARLGEFPYLLRGMMPGLARGGRNFLSAWRTESAAFEEEVTGDSGSSKIEEYVRDVAIEGKKGRVIRTPLRFLLASDEFAKSLVGTMQVQAEAYRMAKAEKLTGNELAARIQVLVDDIGGPAWLAAVEKSKELSFQEELGSLGKIILIARHKVPGLRYIIPFVTTLTNIFRAGFRKSPLGSVPLLYRVLRSGLVRMNWGGKDWSYTRTEFVKHAAEQIIGWGIFFALMSLIAPGEDDLPLITGTIPYSPQSRGQRDLAYRTAPPTSIRIGNRWYSYARIEPFATSIATAVDLLSRLQNAENGEEASKVIGSAYSHIVGQLKDKTFARGISDVLNAIQDGESSVEWAGNFATSWVPNIIRASARESDDMVREQKIWGRGDVWAQRLGDRLSYKAFPSADNAPEAKVDLWGREVTKDSGPSPATDVLWRMFTPARSQKVDVHQLDRIILNWNNQNPNQIYSPMAPAPYWSFGSGRDRRTVYMTDREYNQFLQLAGKMSVARLGGEVFNPEAPTAENMKTIHVAILASRKEARGIVWGTRGSQ